MLLEKVKTHILNIEYVLWSDITDMNYIITNVNTTLILITNSVMIIIWLTGVVGGLL